MKAVVKEVTYTLEDLNDIEVEIKKQWKKGWRVIEKGEVKDSFLFAPKDEITIVFARRN